ncbi:PWWP domain protein, involved in chromatin remodeling [Schizosaccharomyces osmophilus]|uniref:PWWP domain protein, involved in chromatin remodeling n=1 Tax=Schizosaccharomyces osmophilus TaxID=2545709 RepID=A0AAF0AWZ6_9SCHI|nr:PWWP domain protein, involved in chromatin remodeling [Schizosaccharomyces osmophilus]WBW74267.1 PWWP domain protein, involved in chromatin remodeling [Schizosaccharomyces osmophilus]
MVTTRAANQSRDTKSKRSNKQANSKKVLKTQNPKKKPKTENSLKNLQKQVRQDRRWSLKKYEPNKKPDEYFKEGKYILVKYSHYPWWPSRIVRREEIPSDILKRLPKYKGLAVQFLPSRDYAIIPVSNVGCLDLYECLYVLESNRFTSHIRQTIEAIAESIKKDCSFSDVEETEEDEEENEQSEDHENEQISSASKAGKGSNDKRTPKRSQDKEKGEISARDSHGRFIRQKVQTVSPILAPPEEVKEELDEEAEKIIHASPKLPVFSLNLQLNQPLSTAELYAQAHYARAKTLLYYRYKLQKILLTFNHYPTESEMTDVHYILEKLENFSGLNAELIENTKLIEFSSQLKKLSDLQLEHRYHFVDRFHILFTYFLRLSNKPISSSLETNR